VTLAIRLVVVAGAPHDQAMGLRIRTLAIRPDVAVEARRVQAVGPRIVTPAIARAVAGVLSGVAGAVQILIRVTGQDRGGRAAAIQAFLMLIPVMAQAMAGAAQYSARLIRVTKIPAVSEAKAFGGG
jgi:hypothetical protein